MQGKPVAEQEIGKHLLQETASYAESSVCRRKTLLHYFGENYTEDNCGNCDNCLNPKKQVDAKEDLCAVIETVAALKEKFKAEHIIDVITGRETADVKTYKHNELEVFGCEQGTDRKYLNAVIRQATIAGYLERDVENFGMIRLTDKGKKYLKKPVAFKVVEDNDFNEVEEEVVVKSGASCAVDPELYSILKDLRKKIARRLNLPPYVIFQDPSLEAMATTYPITIEELANITGVGAGKAKRYGEDFIRVIKTHVEENEIERPEDLRELANSKCMEFGELLDEIEAIVYSGTKININYFINEVIDDDHQEDILEYFHESETDSLAEAIRELGSDYPEEEIRLMRIKFLSEMGN